MQETENKDQLGPGSEEVVPKPNKKVRKKTSAKKSPNPPNPPMLPMPPILTAEAIFKARDIKEKELEIEEWGGTVIVRGLKIVDHERLIHSCAQGPLAERQFNMVGYQAKVVILCAYDGFMKDGGKPIFEKRHHSMLLEKASAPIAAIATLAHELSGIGKDAAKKAFENLEKTPSADSLFD